MLTQDQHQYHFKLSDARCLCYTQTHTHKQTNTHATKRYTFIIGLKHKYHHRQSCPQISIQTKQLFPKHWELLVTPPTPTSPDALHGHLYANACVLAYCIGDV